MSPTETPAVRSDPYPLLLVRWVDSTSPRSGWIRLQKWEGVGSLECVSVGYLISEEANALTLAPHLAYPDDPEQCQGNGIITIPRGAVISAERLTAPCGAACAAPGRSSDRPESARPSA